MSTWAQKRILNAKSGLFQKFGPPKVFKATPEALSWPKSTKEAKLHRFRSPFLGCIFTPLWMSPTNLSQVRLKTVEKWPFKVVVCAVGALCGPLVAKLCVYWDVCSQSFDLQKIPVDLVCITLKGFFFLQNLVLPRLFKSNSD